MLRVRVLTRAGISSSQVRGLTYKRDRIKVKADFPAFRTLGVDFFELPSPEQHIAKRRESLMHTVRTKESHLPQNAA